MHVELPKGWQGQPALVCRARGGAGRDVYASSRRVQLRRAGEQRPPAGHRRRAGLPGRRLPRDPRRGRRHEAFHAHAGEGHEAPHRRLHAAVRLRAEGGLPGDPPRRPHGRRRLRQQLQPPGRRAPHQANLIDWGHLVAHETFHLWNGTGMEPKVQMDWFKEGFTDYFAILTMARLGLIDECLLTKKLEGPRPASSSIEPGKA